MKRVFVVLLGAAVLGGIVGGAVRLVWPSTALAATCNTNPISNLEASDGYHAGMRSANMTVEDYSESCLEVNSVSVIGPQAASMEIGVGDPAPNTTFCGASGLHFFMVHTSESGQYYCEDPSVAVTAWDKEGFAVADQNQDGNWTFWHNGSVVSNGFGTLDWSKGTAITNSERHSTARH